MGPHPLAGHLSVDASARRIRHYRFAEERMMRILGGWIALTPELSAKLLFGRHVWDCAQHADLWGRRLPELRSPAQQSEPANDAVIRFMDLLETPDGRADTARRITGVYGVLKPHLAALYRRHLAETNPVYEPPTRRILERCLAEERRHVAAAAVLLERLFGVDRPEEAVRWRQRLLSALAEAGGITGDEPAPPVEEPPRDVDPATVAQDLVAVPPPFDPAIVPADLAAAVAAHGRALADGDLSRAEAQVDEEARPAFRAEYARLRPPFAASRIVALATIGAYRVVKLALESPAGVSVLQLRWKPTDGGWRVVGCEVVRDGPRASCAS